MNAVIMVVGVAELGASSALLADTDRVPSPTIQLMSTIRRLLVDERHLRMDQVGIACLMLILLLCLVDEHLNEVSTKLLF